MVKPVAPAPWSKNTLNEKRSFDPAERRKGIYGKPTRTTFATPSNRDIFDDGRSRCRSQTQVFASAPHVRPNKRRRLNDSLSSPSLGSGIEPLEILDSFSIDHSDPIEDPDPAFDLLRAGSHAVTHDAKQPHDLHPPRSARVVPGPETPDSRRSSLPSHEQKPWRQRSLNDLNRSRSPIRQALARSSPVRHDFMAKSAPKTSPRLGQHASNRSIASTLASNARNKSLQDEDVILVDADELSTATSNMSPKRKASMLENSDRPSPLASLCNDAFGEAGSKDEYSKRSAAADSPVPTTHTKVSAHFHTSSPIGGMQAQNHVRKRIASSHVDGHDFLVAGSDHDELSGPNTIRTRPKTAEHTEPSTRSKYFERMPAHINDSDPEIFVTTARRTLRSPLRTTLPIVAKSGPTMSPTTSLSGAKSNGDAPVEKRSPPLQEMDGVEDQPASVPRENPTGDMTGSILPADLSASIPTKKRSPSLDGIAPAASPTARLPGQPLAPRRSDRKKLNQNQVKADAQDAARPSKSSRPWLRPLMWPFDSSNKVQVIFEDLARLDEDGMLNDNIVSFELRRLELESSKATQQAYFFNSYFFDSLTKSPPLSGGINYEKVASWTRKVDIFSFRYLIVPVCSDAHWYLFIVCNAPRLVDVVDLLQADEDVPSSSAFEDNKHASLGQGELSQETTLAVDKLPLGSMSLHPDKTDPLLSPVANSSPLPEHVSKASSLASGKRSSKSRHGKKLDPSAPLIIALDSMGQTHTSEMTKLKRWLTEEAKDKKGLEITPAQITSTSAKGIPTQTNMVDCGVFLIGYLAEFLKNPTRFMEKVCNREMDTNNDFAGFSPREERRRIRKEIEKLHAEQTRRRKEARAAKGQASDPQSTMQGRSSASLKQGEAVPPLEASSVNQQGPGTVDGSLLLAGIVDAASQS